MLTLLQEWGGWFEVPTGVPSPPPSPPGGPQDLQRPKVSRAGSRGGDVALHITEECERLFCETLRAVFLVEKNTGAEDSLVMAAPSKGSSNRRILSADEEDDGMYGHLPVRAPDALPTPAQSPDGGWLYPIGSLQGKSAAVTVKSHMEAYDYTGGIRFRGFVAEKHGSGQTVDERALFVFFDRQVIGHDLKPALTALLELASMDALDCSQLVVCVDRDADVEVAKDLTKDLGWVGFELMMLDEWTDGDRCVSDQWIFLSMDV